MNNTATPAVRNGKEKTFCNEINKNGFQAKFNGELNMRPGKKKIEFV